MTNYLIIRKSKLLIWGSVGALSVFILGFWQGYKIGEAVTHQDHSSTKTRHVAACEYGNDKYRRYAAYDTNGERICFNQSKLTGKIERVSLVVRGL